MSKGLSKCFISLIVFKLKLMIGFLVFRNCKCGTPQFYCGPAQSARPAPRTLAFRYRFFRNV